MPPAYYLPGQAYQIRHGGQNNYLKAQLIDVIFVLNPHAPRGTREA
jgi:hypothetical protein